MNVWNILCAFGIPAMVIGILKVIFNQINGIKKGVQALLRAQMIADYNKYKDLGYAPIYAKDNFENCWRQYHSLGVNGVMDGLHEEFLALPTEPPNNSKGETA